MNFSKAIQAGLMLILLFLSFLKIPSSVYAYGGSFLNSNDVIDSDHKSIKNKVNELITTSMTKRQAAIAIHNFVRDEIEFGFSRSFYRVSASDVLSSKIGYCIPKGTLFVAMLRAASIPARLHFVEIASEINDPFGVPPGYLDHAYTEVYLDGKWIKTDSYIVDKKLFMGSKKKLEQENLVIGYGIHGEGSYEWDGINNSFGQYYVNGSFENLGREEFGIFEGYKDFYQNVDGNNELNFVMQTVVWLSIGSLNRRIRAVRDNN